MFDSRDPEEKRRIDRYDLKMSHINKIIAENNEEIEEADIQMRAPEL